uniref:hypothetical protein n=1 Tax=Castellaniella defragrans TaxID=75697 RepID=UPI003341F2BC
MAKLLSGVGQTTAVVRRPQREGGRFGNVALVLMLLMAGFFAGGAFASTSSDGSRPSSPSVQKYTGALRINSDMEYVALDQPSTIGGACDGWNAIAVQKPGMPATATTNTLCWKLENGGMAVTDKDGKQKTIGPISAWSD